MEQVEQVPQSQKRKMNPLTIVLVLLCILSVGGVIVLKQNIAGMKRELAFLQAQPSNTQNQKIKKPVYKESYTNEEYNFKFDIPQFKAWSLVEGNPSYSFYYVQEFDTILRIYRIVQDALTNEITAALTETYEIHEVSESDGNDLASWWEEKKDLVGTPVGYDGYMIGKFSDLPCISIQDQDLRDNPVLMILDTKGVSRHSYYYIYFDFGKPFLLGYTPGWDMACDFRLPVDTITRLHENE